jgi:polyhydroxybutyrate depolymerase
VYFTGHDNGGFMAYRLACDHSDKIAAIAVMGAAMFQN